MSVEEERPSWRYLFASPSASFWVMMRNVDLRVVVVDVVDVVVLRWKDVSTQEFELSSTDSVRQ